MRLARVAVLSAIVAGSIIAILSLTGVIPPGRVARVALRTFASLVVLFAAAFAWRSVRTDTGAPDRTDRPVP